MFSTAPSPILNDCVYDTLAQIFINVVSEAPHLIAADFLNSDHPLYNKLRSELEQHFALNISTMTELQFVCCAHNGRHSCIKIAQAFKNLSHSFHNQIILKASQDFDKFLSKQDNIFSKALPWNILINTLINSGYVTTETSELNLLLKYSTEYLTEKKSQTGSPEIKFISILCSLIFQPACVTTTKIEKQISTAIEPLCFVTADKTEFLENKSTYSIYHPPYGTELPLEFKMNKPLPASHQIGIDRPATLLLFGQITSQNRLKRSIHEI